jgi:hypothetical protein
MLLLQPANDATAYCCTGCAAAGDLRWSAGVRSRGMRTCKRKEEVRVEVSVPSSSERAGASRSASTGQASNDSSDGRSSRPMPGMHRTGVVLAIRCYVSCLAELPTKSWLRTDLMILDEVYGPKGNGSRAKVELGQASPRRPRARTRRPRPRPARLPACAPPAPKCCSPACSRARGRLEGQIPGTQMGANPEPSLMKLVERQPSHRRQTMAATTSSSSQSHLPTSSALSTARSERHVSGRQSSPRFALLYTPQAS